MRRALSVAAVIVLASCGGGSEDVSPPAQVAGPDQFEFAEWAAGGARAIRSATDDPGRCDVMDATQATFFETAQPEVLDGSADPDRVWGAASAFSLTANEAQTFCTWTVLDPALVGEAAETMAGLLETIADGLVTPPE